MSLKRPTALNCNITYLFLSLIMHIFVFIQFFRYLPETFASSFHNQSFNVNIVIQQSKFHQCSNTVFKSSYLSLKTFSQLNNNFGKRFSGSQSKI